MSNYDENDQESVARFVLENLSRHGHFAIATTNDDGTPWVVCVNLAYDDGVNFIWRSLKETEHSKNINARPEVAICVFSKTPEVGDFGYYCQATAHEVNDQEELKRLLAFRYAGREVPPLADFLEDSPGRIYYANVTKAWINDDRHIKTLVDLEVLRNNAKDAK